MDPSIKKESILEQKRQNREEGKERRQSRRLRRQLEPLLAGDSITGVVDRVTTEGVLVTISSLGPLNVTALISVRDMPKQFEVPGDLASSFQVEILQQDFYPGREVRCSVLKIHPSPSPSKKYNIKLLFEDFEGQANYDDVEITDRGEVTNVKVLKNGGGAEYDDEVEDYDDDDEDEEVDLEIVEIFDELRGADSQVEVEKFLAWEDILDMIEEGNISQKDIINMMRSIGAKGKYLDIKEFNKVINMIQDHLEEQELVGEDLDDDDEDADEEEDDKNNLDGDDDDFGDDGDDAEDIAEIYSDLKGDNQYLSVGSLKNWAEIKEILKSKQVSMAKIDQMLKDLRVDGKKGLTLTQFQSFVNSIDEAIMFEEDMKEVEQEKEVKKPKETKVVAVEQPPVVVAKKGKVEKVEEEGDYDEDAEDDTFFLEIFNDLKNKQGVVTINAFKEWDDVREMIADGDLTESKLDSVIEDVVGFSIQKKGKKASAAAASTFILSFDQFKEILEILDQELMENSVDEEVGDDEEDMNAVENSEEDGTDGEQMAVDDEELNRELFEELSQDGKVVKVKAFREWDEMVELFDQQYLDKDSFEAILLEVGAKPNGNLNFQQFSQLLRLIDETTQAMAGGINPEDAVVDSKGTKKSVATEEDEDDDYIEEDDEDYSDEDEEGVNEEIVREMFDDLRGKSSKLSMSKLKNWDLLQEMIDQNVMSLATFNVLVQEVTDQPSPKDLDFEQFKQIVKLLNQANDLVNGEMPSAGDDEEEESMLDEQTSQEFFDALKGKNGKVSIKSLKSWDVLEDELESGALTLKDIDEAVVAAGFTSTTQLTLPDFIKVLDEIGDRVRGLEGEDDEEYDDEEEEEEESKESLAAKQKEAALQAAFSNRKTADSASSAGKSSTGTGFQRQSEDEIKQGKARAKEAKQAVVALPPANNKLKQRIDEVTQDMFDELRGKSKTIPLKAFRQWDELNKMLNNGKVKHSTLERALHKFGVLDNESLDLEQFAQILEVLQQAVDFSDLGAAVPDVTANKQMKTSKNSKVLLTKDDNDANEEEDEDNSIPADLDEEDEEGDEEEEAALEIFDELCGPKRKALPLADFFKWEDIQSLLESGALTKEKLALAVEQTGVDVSKPEQCKLNFATVSVISRILISLYLKFNWFVFSSMIYCKLSTIMWIPQNLREVNNLCPLRKKSPEVALMKKMRMKMKMKTIMRTTMMMTTMMKMVI